MSRRSQQPININLNETGINCDAQYSEFKEYIVKNNINLQEENKILREVNKDLENKNLEKENEEDKYDNRIRYMKGLMNNLNEMNNIHKNLIKETEEITDTTIKYKTELYNNVKLFTIKYFFNILGLFIWNVSFNIIFYDILLNIYNTFITYFVNAIIYGILIKIFMDNTTWYDKRDKLYYKTIANNIEQIKKLKSELKNLKETTLSLDNWICEI